MARLIVALILTLATAVPATAQEAPGFRSNAGRKAVNVRFELTITDYTAAGSPLKKSIMWVLADGFQSRVRSTGVVHLQEKSGVDSEGAPIVFTKPMFEVELNVDSSVQVLEPDTIRAEFTVQYTPGIAGSIAPSGTVKPSPLNESVTVILTSGKPLVITQAADPVSDRRIDVQVTATILR